MPFSLKPRIGVLRGGPSPEYEVSLKTGGAILANMPEQYEPIDLFISKDGVWHMAGAEKEPHNILKSIDLAVNALHGAYGEDGTVQRLLEELGTPYTGSRPLPSAYGMNKIMAKELFRRIGLKVPHHLIIEKGSESKKRIERKIFEDIPFPIIIKPYNSGSSLGVNFVERREQIRDALENSFTHSPKLIVEEFINGKEATCGVIDGFRGKDFYNLLPVEINSPLLDYESKYRNSESRYKVPGNFTEEEKMKIQEAAIIAHSALGLRHYSRADFVMAPRRGLFILEVNSLPEIAHRSSFMKSLEAAGGSIKEFLSHLISKALQRN